MNTYKNETDKNLVRLIVMLTKDKKALIRDGFVEAANQNQQVIEAMMTELQSRSKAVA
jgi:hypothetical protein